MAKHYGDIPCCRRRADGKVHITISVIECLCGAGWQYRYAKSSPPMRAEGIGENIIWRDIEGVTCEKCKEIYKSREEAFYGSNQYQPRPSEIL